MAFTHWKAGRTTPSSPTVQRHRFLNRPALDLLPWGNVGRILLIPGNPIVEFDPLRTRQRRRVGFKALPQRVKQFVFLCCGKGLPIAFCKLLIASPGFLPVRNEWAEPKK